MTTYIVSETVPCQQAIHKALVQAGAEKRVMLGLDLELAGAAGALMIGGGTPLYIGKHARPRWVELVSWLVRQGAQVHVAQEACGFGWEFHRQLQAAGATSCVVAPQEMSGKRKTDRRDASALCVLLWDRVGRANLKSLRIVSVPTVAEQQRRGYHRSRSQWLRLRNRVEAQGRSLMWDHGWLEVPKGWWRLKPWSQLKAALEAAHHQWLVDLLSASQSLCLVLEQRLKVLQAQAVAAGVQAREACAAIAGIATPSPVLLPKGLGELTYATLQTEVRDWRRFANRGQAGSFIGCCPSEHSSGPRQKLGEIDRMGSKRLRTALVEAVWRVNKWNPGWRGLRRFAEVLGPQAKASGARKRKAIVACARLLMIDLWRLHVGTATLEGLGLQPAD